MVCIKTFVYYRNYLYSFCTFFLLVGIFVDKEAIAYGSCVFYVLLFSILIVLRVYFHYRKVLKAYFRDANSDGNIELTISYGI